MRRVAFGMAALAVAVYAATGLAVVPQDEIGIVRRFGRPLAEPWSPGLHWGLPWGMDRLDRLKVGQARTLTVGAAGPADAPLARAPDPGDDVLTADLNLVTIGATLQFRVADPVAYLFAAHSAEESLIAATRAALIQSVSSRTIDDVLTSGRAEVAERAAAVVQREADRLGLGVSIRAVRLARLAPPAPVVPAFADVARARSDRRRAVTAAKEYRDRAEADARGQAREIADRAAARADRTIALARGEADRFTRVLDQARRDPDATRRRLYRETLVALWPRFARKVIVQPDEELDLGLFAESMEAEPGTSTPHQSP